MPFRWVLCVCGFYYDVVILFIFFVGGVGDF